MTIISSFRLKTYFNELGVRGVRKPQNRVKKRKKPQYRIEIYQNTETELPIKALTNKALLVFRISLSVI